MKQSVSDARPRELAEFIWRTHYRDARACPPELTVEDTWKRVATAVATMEGDPPLWSARFLNILQGFQFLPGGRILAGAGTHRQVTLFNCFVMGLIEDSVVGIFEALKDGAITLQQGGGVGYDFSTLRPRGMRAQASGTIASGPVSFLKVWDAVCATILSTGARRGAMMATLRCDHPDIEEFIDAKCDPASLPRFSLSVLLTASFMQAVASDSEWPLVFPDAQLDPRDRRESLERAWSGHPDPVRCRVHKRLRARELWDRLCASAHQCAEPGVLFIDRINSENNLAYCETLSATNPCAEAPLPPFGACNLGSLNLASFVRAPFTAQSRIDLATLRSTAAVAVRFLDNVIDLSQFPLQLQREQVLRSRRLGLGITGLGDALAMLGVPYGSAAGRALATQTIGAIRDAAYAASADLARERGSFPALDVDRYLERPFIQRLPAELRAQIARGGIRNSHLLAIAPTGTISLLAGNLSSGIEPIPGLETTRLVLDERGGHRQFTAGGYAYAVWRNLHPREPCPPAAFLEGSALAPRDHLLMQGALQPYVDGAISKTVPLARGAAPFLVSELFRFAYDQGLKGCTVFREGSREAPVHRTSAQAS